VFAEPPPNFNGFRVLASLLQRRHSLEANQTLHDVWPSPGLVRCVYISGGFCPLTEFCHVQTSLCVQVLHSLVISLTALDQWSSGKLCGVVYRKGITEFSQRVSRIFGWAAITLGVVPHSSFYSAPQCSHCKRSISCSNFVCPSVCPSHAGIVSKRRHVARRSFHCWIAKCV